MSSQKTPGHWVNSGVTHRRRKGVPAPACPGEFFSLDSWAPLPPVTFAPSILCHSTVLPGKPLPFSWGLPPHWYICNSHLRLVCKTQTETHQLSPVPRFPPRYNLSSFPCPQQNPKENPKFISVSWFLPRRCFLPLGCQISPLPSCPSAAFNPIKIPGHLWASWRHSLLVLLLTM